MTVQAKSDLSRTRHCTDNLWGKKNLINSFSALPDLQKADIIQRLDSLRETLVATHKAARASIDLISLTTQKSCQHIQKRRATMAVHSPDQGNPDPHTLNIGSPGADSNPSILPR